MVENYSSKKNWPIERKTKPKNLNTDELGFSYTPEGSFYDPDDEYFNRYGFDIHGGWYSKQKEYIPGPDWLSDLGCYEDEREKYLNIKDDSSEGEENFNEPDFGYGDDDLNEEGEYFDNFNVEEKLKELNIDINDLKITDKEVNKNIEKEKEVQYKKSHRGKKKK